MRNQADNDIYLITTSGAEQLFSPSLALTCDPDVAGRDALCRRCAEEGGGGGAGESALASALLRRESVLNAAAGSSDTDASSQEDQRDERCMRELIIIIVFVFPLTRGGCTRRRATVMSPGLETSGAEDGT